MSDSTPWSGCDFLNACAVTELAYYPGDAGLLLAAPPSSVFSSSSSTSSDHDYQKEGMMDAHQMSHLHHQALHGREPPPLCRLIPSVEGHDELNDAVNGSVGIDNSGLDLDGLDSIAEYPTDGSSVGDVFFSETFANGIVGDSTVSVNSGPTGLSTNGPGFGRQDHYPITVRQQHHLQPLQPQHLQQLQQLHQQSQARENGDLHRTGGTLELPQHSHHAPVCSPGGSQQPGAVATHGDASKSSPGHQQATDEKPVPPGNLPDSPPDSGSEPFSPPDSDPYRLKGVHLPSGDRNSLPPGLQVIPLPQGGQATPAAMMKASPGNGEYPVQHQQHIPQQNPHVRMQLHQQHEQPMPVGPPFVGLAPQHQLSPQMYHGGPGMPPPHLPILNVNGGGIMSHQSHQQAPMPGPYQQQMFPESHPHVTMELVSGKKRKLDQDNVDIRSSNGVYKVDPDERKNCIGGPRADLCSPREVAPCPENVISVFDDESLSGGADFDYQFGAQNRGHGGGGAPVGDQIYAGGDSQNQCIRFVTFQPETWGTLVDAMGNNVNLQFQVDADKGFNFSHSDDSFVCQKKNHFQVTCHLQPSGVATFVKLKDRAPEKLDSLQVNFFGVKAESPSQTIKIEQSQSDRSKKGFSPVKLELDPSQITKVTVGRLHFSETTTNNMRKKGKPNPDQRYFFLVVALQAHLSGDRIVPIFQYASDKIIVRASNPGQFENDSEIMWMKSPNCPENVFHHGKVGINTDNPDQTLTIYGNLKLTGQILQPSDSRVKEKVRECDSRDQLDTVCRLRVVDFEVNEEMAKSLGRRSGKDRGLIAQEVAQVIPDAVHPTGRVVLSSGRVIENLLTVDKERIFMENLGAVKELNKVVGRMQIRISELEKVQKKLAKFRRASSARGSTSSESTVNGSVASSLRSNYVPELQPSNGKPHKHKNKSRSSKSKSCNGSLSGSFDATPFHPFDNIGGSDHSRRHASIKSATSDRFDQCDACCQHHHIYCLQENRRHGDGKRSGRNSRMSDVCPCGRKGHGPVGRDSIGRDSRCSAKGLPPGDGKWRHCWLGAGVCGGLAVAVVVFTVAFLLMSRFGVIQIPGRPGNFGQTTPFPVTDGSKGTWIWSPFPFSTTQSSIWEAPTSEISRKSTSDATEAPLTTQRSSTVPAATSSLTNFGSTPPFRTLPPVIGKPPICNAVGPAPSSAVLDGSQCQVICRPQDCPVNHPVDGITRSLVIQREQFPDPGLNWSLVSQTTSSSIGSSTMLSMSPIMRHDAPAGTLSNHIPETSLSSSDIGSDVLVESPVKVSRVMSKLRRRRNLILEEENAVPVSKPLEKGSIVSRFRLGGGSVVLGPSKVPKERMPADVELPPMGKDDLLVVDKRLVVAPGERGNSVDDDVLSRPTPIDHIVLVEVNRTLTSQYCLDADHGCVYGTSGNWTYGIPISMFSYFEVMNLQFVYTPWAGSNGKLLPIPCDSMVPPSPCSEGSPGGALSGPSSPTPPIGPNEHLVTSSSDSEHTVSVELRKNQAILFRFRVPTENKYAEGVCDLDSKYLEDRFFEYNFLFYRVCQ